MPAFTALIDGRISPRKLGIKNQSIKTSIYGKIKTMVRADALKFVKRRKKDVLYNLYLHFNSVSE